MIASPANGHTPSGWANEPDALLETFTRITPSLGQALHSSIEVVVHDLRRIPNTIVAVYGDVTGRQIGDPATDLLLHQVASNDFCDKIGYRTTAADGRSIRSTTMFIFASGGDAIGALCLNMDVSRWETAHRLIEEFTDNRPPEDTRGRVARDEERHELFARDVGELANHLVSRAINSQQIPVEFMRKEQKIAVIKDLKSHGHFLLRDGVELAASALQVSRFTIYNYLNELEESPNLNRERDQ